MVNSLDPWGFTHTDPVSQDRLIFITRIPILVRWYLFIEMAPVRSQIYRLVVYKGLDPISNTAKHCPALGEGVLISYH